MMMMMMMMMIDEIKEPYYTVHSYIHSSYLTSNLEELKISKLQV